MIRLLSIFILSIASFSFAQNYPVHEIPSELSKDAYAVVRNEAISVKVSAANKITYSKEYAVTVFNKSGDAYAQAYQIYNPDNKINRLEAVFYDQNGKEIRKFRTRDFRDQSYITGGQMYTDTRLKFLNYVPVNYPYTMVFRSETTNSNTFINPWFPVRHPNLAIEKSSFSLENESGIEILSKELNLSPFKIPSQDTKNSRIFYELKNLKAFEFEELMPSMKQLYPYVEFSATEFIFDGVKGKFKNWQELGQWYQTLISDANDFTPQQKDFFRNLVKDAKSNKEKVQILYKYLQDKTRYIGIQLGIGGLKPFPASYVQNKSYGDCKALTNYLQSMLEAVDIKSYYTIVQAGAREDLFSDFASLAQGNHVILYVPLEEEEIWLEATSQRTAFNFLGSFTDDRMVFIVTPEGGEILRTQKFESETNKSLTKGFGELLANGTFKADISISNSGLEYESFYGLSYESPTDQIKHIRSLFDYLPNLNIRNYSVENNWEDAIYTLNLELESGQFAQTFGQSMTLNLLPAGGLGSSLRKLDNRIHPFEIPHGVSHETEFEIKLPKGYKVSEQFKPIVFSDDFGRYFLATEELENGNLKVRRNLLIKEGTYPKEKYNDYVDFRRTVSSYDNTKILIEKI